MKENGLEKTPFSFRVIGVIALIWNVLGAINFLVQMNPASLEAYRESERLIIEGRPLWATLGFALAVFGGALGCLVLLFRKRIAFYIFVASFFGVVITMVHALSTGIDFGLGEVVGIIFMPLLVAIFLVWYSSFAGHKGWLS